MLAVEFGTAARNQKSDAVSAALDRVENRFHAIPENPERVRSLRVETAFVLHMS